MIKSFLKNCIQKSKTKTKTKTALFPRGAHRRRRRRRGRAPRGGTCRRRRASPGRPPPHRAAPLTSRVAREAPEPETPTPQEICRLCLVSSRLTVVESINSSLNHSELSLVTDYSETQTASSIDDDCSPATPQPRLARESEETSKLVLSVLFS